MFETGDYIRVIEGTILESGDKVNSWAGRIIEVDNDEKCCVVQLDSQTIDSLDEAYILNALKVGASLSDYVFSFTDIEPARRRDTNNQREKALGKLSLIANELEGRLEQLREEQKKLWIDEFLKSDIFDSQTNYQKENSSFIIGTFIDLLYNYEYVTLENCEPESLVEICLYTVPSKVTSEIKLFKNFGIAIEKFITYLGINQYVANWLELVKVIRSIKDKIPIEASNPANWGMAKSMMMGAQKSGIDFNSEEELKSYFFDLNEEAKVIPLKPDIYKGIRRNQRITVKYNEGELIKDIKFKKVEEDLRNGKCELISDE